jgi:hypothetical protein
MFIYPLTSQLNGFYKTILEAEGLGQKAIKTAEVMTAATTIAYLESSITKMSFKWSDEKEMTKDVLQSLLGNIPVVSQISYSLIEDSDLQIMPGLSGIISLKNKINQYAEGSRTGIDLAFAVGEVFGVPTTFRRIWEGMEILEEGGIKDRNGKMLAPVKETDEVLRSFLRGKYGSIAAQDWIRNVGEKSENKRWFVPEVEFLQNSDYDRKAELYISFSDSEREELSNFLSDGQRKMLQQALYKTRTGIRLSPRKKETTTETKTQNNISPASSIKIRK